MSATNGSDRRWPGQGDNGSAPRSSGAGSTKSPRFTEQDLEGAFARLLSATEAALAELPDDPLQVELLISEISAPWSAFPCDADTGPDAVIGQGFINYAERSATPAAQAVLRGLTAMGSDRQRSTAAAAADRLAARGIPEAAWAAGLTALRVTGCWAIGDIFGDQTDVVLGFERGGRRHSMVVSIQHNMGEIATDSFITVGQEWVPADVVAQVRQRRMTMQEIRPAVARGIVEAALAATDTLVDPPVSKTYWFTRTLLLARLQVLPPAEPQRGDLAPAERSSIVADFLVSTHAAELTDRDAVRRCAELIVQHSCAFDQGRALRVSPTKTQTFLLAWVPLKAVLSERERDAMPAVVAAWQRWAGERSNLPDWARQELDEAIDVLSPKFPAAYADPYHAGPAKSWVADPGEDVPGFDQVQSVVARRTFAMPYVGIRIGDKDYPELDAGDEQQRWLLIIGEHPEYHEMLGGPEPDFDALIDAVWPQAHLIIHEIVTTQLWNDDPPEAWQAACRLTAAGIERHQALHMIGDVVIRHLGEGSCTHQRELPGDPAYRHDLDELGRSTTPRPRDGSEQ